MTVVPQISLPRNRQLALATVDHQIKWLLNVSLLFFTIKSGWYLSSTVEEQREMAKLKADKEERRAIRKKKAIQKANQQADMDPGSDDDFEPRANPLVIPFYFNVSHILNFFCSSRLVRWLPRLLLVNEVARSRLHAQLTLLKNL
jgi:hypothetical protein